MKDDICRDITPHLAALDEAPEAQVTDPRIAGHLAECPACQRTLQLQREVHGLLRARSSGLQARAPETLRTRLAGHVQAVAAGSRRKALWRLPVAASVLLGVLGAGTYGLTSASPAVLAAQLTLDHLKCVRLVSPGTPINGRLAMAEWARRYEWTPRLPATSSPRASLVGVRRCLYGHGHLAHLLYEVDGRTVSVFVMPRRDYPAGDPPVRHEFLGQHAEVWGRGAESFAVIGDGSPESLASMAEAVRSASN
jgi:anti-sigma factor RsiW